MKLWMPLLLVATALLAVRLFYTGDIGEAGPELRTPGDSDYYMTDARVWQIDREGQLAYRMNVALSLHFPDDSARFEDISVHYRAGTPTYWDVEASRGRIPPGARDIYLYDGVTGRHPEHDGQMVDITTDHAWVRPDDDRIDTDARVIAKAPGRRAESDGMTVDLGTDTLKLLNNVQVTYTP